MTTAIASSPWAAPAPPAPLRGWRLACGVDLPGADGQVAGLRWVLARNCSIAPRQLLGVYLSLCALSFTVAAGFWWHGAPVVMAFAGIELLLVGVAMLVYARHAGDRETVTVAEQAVEVEQYFGSQVHRAAFRAEWVRIEPARAQGSLVELAGQGQRVQVGRFLRPEQRPVLAQELRRALRRAQAGWPAQESELEVQR